MGMSGPIFVELAKGGGETEEIMIDATHLKAHRTAHKRALPRFTH
jgi:putative transposase